MKNKSIIVLVILVLSFLFYWFQIRPANIRKEYNDHVLSNGLYRVSNEERDELGGDMQKINKEEEIRLSWCGIKLQTNFLWV